MNRLKEDRQIAIISALVEGNSIRGIERMSGVHRDTIMRLMVRTGNRCQSFMDRMAVNLDFNRLEFDEIWTFCRKKQGRLSDAEQYNTSLGDQYVFYGIDAISKFVPAWVIGKRNSENTYIFIRKMKNTLNGTRPQISTDAWGAYADAIERIFGGNVDYGRITKEYESEHIGRGRYAPPRVSGCKKTPVSGRPDPRYISTSYIERSNLTMRTLNRRFTRLALGFSKKLENLKATVALYFTYYNFCWIPRTTRVTPAIAAGITPSPWDIEELFYEISN